MIILARGTVSDQIAEMFCAGEMICFSNRNSSSDRRTALVHNVYQLRGRKVCTLPSFRSPRVDASNESVLTCGLCLLSFDGNILRELATPVGTAIV